MLGNVDRGVPRRTQGDRVAGAGVDILHFRAISQIDAGEEGVVAQVGDLDPVQLEAQLVDDRVQQLVGLRARRRSWDWLCC